MIINWKNVIGEDSKYSFYNGGWVKQVTGIDKSQSDGYCFRGEFVRGATEGKVELDDGYYIVCSIEGSRKNQRKEYAVYRIIGGQVEKAIGWVCGRDWALQIRDQLADLLAQGAPAVELSDEELALIEALKALSPDRLKAVLAAAGIGGRAE